MSEARSGPTVGEPAPDFRLPAGSGEELSLAELRGRQVLVATCHPALATRLGALGAAVIATPGRREPSPVG